MLDKITNLMTRKVIPTAYDDSLSYYEQVLVLLDKVNELVDFINSIQNEYKTYTDEKIALLQASVNAQINAVYGYADQIKIDLEQLIGYNKDEITDAYTSMINSLSVTLNARISNEVQTLNNRIDSVIATEISDVQTLNARITSEVNTINSRISYEVQNLKSYIDSKVIEVQLFNPVTGQLEPLQSIVNMLVDMQKVNALTAGEYDALQLTASYYDGKDLNAFQFDFSSKTLLP